MIRLAALLLCLASPLGAETLRIAFWNVGLSRDGPGLLLTDFAKQTDELGAIRDALSALSPDILVLAGFDNDYEGRSLGQMQALLVGAGLDYPHALALHGNEGQPSGLDLDADGRLNGWGDNWGFGKFRGQDSMALFSTEPLGEARVWTALRWTDLPGATMPATASGPFPSAETAPLLRLSSRSHWDVALQTGAGPLHLLISNPTPPVFDGPEDANGLRNNDEIGFWLHYLDGAALTDDAGNAAPFTGARFIVIGDLNADPDRGDGIGTNLRALLAHPDLQDPDQLQSPTAYWESLPPMRADYILPSTGINIVAGGTEGPVEAADTAHRLIWLDISL